MLENKFSESNLINAIKRSGYLFESEVVKNLSRRNFFIESNQCIQDPISGKSREIDIIAESELHDSRNSKIKLYSNVKFTFELKNNDFPLVLMTNQPFSPNTMLHEQVKMFTNFQSEHEIVYSISAFEEFTDYNDSSIFTQYCTFAKKKSKDTNNQLMAHHPDYLYSGLLKISQYCDETIDFCKKDYKDLYNIFGLWIPILLIKDNLFELAINNNEEPRLISVEESKLVFNYYYKKEPKSSIIYIVTQKGLDPFLDKILNFQNDIKDQIMEQIEKKD